MSSRERQVFVLSKDGGVLFHGQRCLITDNPDGTMTITDLTIGAPPYVRAALANLARWNDGSPVTPFDDQNPEKYAAVVDYPALSDAVSGLD